MKVRSELAVVMRSLADRVGPGRWRDGEMGEGDVIDVEEFENFIGYF